MNASVRYRARQHIRPKELERIDLQPYRHGAPRTLELEELLFDTAEHHLARTGHVLRARRHGGDAVLSLEHPSGIAGEASDVLDREAVDPEDAGEPTSWPRGFRDRLRYVVGVSPIRELARVRDRRRAWDLYRDDDVIGELALHRLRVDRGDRRSRVEELEIVLGEGARREDLSRLACLVTSALPLDPEPSDETERAVALAADGAESLRVAAARVPMRPDAALSEAMRAAMAAQLLHLHEALPIARAGNDPEGVHDARVAIRRLRAILELCGETGFRRRLVGRLRRGLAKLARALGRVRDADVSLARARAAAASGDRHARRHGIEHRRLREVLDARRTLRLLSRMRRFVTTPAAGLRRGAEDGEPVRVRDAAGRLLWARYERVRRYEPALRGSPLATLHALRIDVKRLRYAVELFGTALGGTSSQLMRPLVATQDHLGELHDLAVASARTGRRARPDASASTYATALAAQLARFHAGAPDAVAPLLDGGYRARLAAAIAAM